MDSSEKDARLLASDGLRGTYQLDFKQLPYACMDPQPQSLVFETLNPTLDLELRHSCTACCHWLPGACKPLYTLAPHILMVAF